MLRRTAAAVAAVLGLTFAVAGCSDDGEEKADHDTSPAKAVAAAKARLDGTSGVRFTLASQDVPDSVTALLSASGVLTHAPAFDGTIVVQLAGLKPEVPVVAVDGKVYAQLPLTNGWQDIDPDDYGAPDPADLMDPDTGLSSMLTATTGLTKGDVERGGEGNKEILTAYAGTLPRASAATLLPGVSGDVAATYTLTSDDELRKAVLEGDFYGTGASETYTVTLDDYGTKKDITAP